MMGIPAAPSAPPVTVPLGDGDSFEEATDLRTNPAQRAGGFAGGPQPDLELDGADEVTLLPTNPGPAPAQRATIMMDGGPAASSAAQAPTLIGAQAPSPAAQAATLIGALTPGPAQAATIVGMQGMPQLGALGPQRISAPTPTVVDVTPRGLGIGTVAGYCEELIRRNSRVPTEMVRMFTTSRDRQQSVRIRVCQGESRRIDENLVIGDLVLDGLEARPRGETTIEVTFAIDHSGILQVRARDARTGREQRASLDILGAQSAAEVDAAKNRLRELRS